MASSSIGQPARMTGIRLSHIGIATAIGLVMLLIGSGCLSHSRDGGGLRDLGGASGQAHAVTTASKR
ncbi:hypothetical protein ABH920_004139 [Catenulispora sp. EB89]